MQLRLDQLDKHLQQPLAPVYLISGDVPLLIQEACDHLRSAATKQGFTEREIFQVETGFNWNNLTDISNTLSLFSTKQLIELRVNNSITEASSKVLQAYLAQPPSDKILLICTHKLDAKTQQTAWFQAINKIGITLAIWPIEKAQLPTWIAKRLAQAELQAEPAGIQLLAEHVEGNLLACAQEIEKLKLMYGKGSLSTEAIAQAISNSSRFNIFNLTDAITTGNKKRILQILHGLKNEAIEPILVLWALARAARNTRNPKQAALLKQAYRIDCMIKGLEIGNVWHELQRLSLALVSNTK